MARRHLAACACACAITACVMPAAAQIHSITLQPPSRDFGYFPGELMTATAVIVTGPDTVLDPRTLPAPGPASASIDVRAAQFSADPVPQGRRTTIRVEYQTFFAPEQVLRADVPGYAVTFAQGSNRLTASVPGFSFAASTFRHDIQPVLDPGALRPDHPQDLVAASGAGRMMVAGGAAALLGLMLAVWPGGHWRAMLSGRQRPFAAAARSLRRRTTIGPDALLLLHRAFDATAGQRVLVDDLDRFFERSPAFLPLREQIAWFFLQSRLAFFGDGQVDWSGGDLVRLSRELARVERG
jgi:mxaA protein